MNQGAEVKKPIIKEEIKKPIIQEENKKSIIQKENRLYQVGKSLFIKALISVLLF